MEKLTGVFLAIVAVVLAACISPPAQKDRQYDNDNFLNFPGQEIEKTASATVFIETTLRVKTPDGKTAVSGGGGRGLILSHQGNNYILTASHVVNPTLASPGAKILAAMLEPLESNYLLKIKEPPFFVKLELVFASRDIDHEPDVALLRVPNDINVKSFPYKIGDSSQLREGDIVFMGGSDESNTEFKIKPSNVGPKISDPAFSAEERNFLFMMRQVEFHRGESGSPVLTFRNGKNELVGIAVQVNEKGHLGYAVKINEALDLIEKNTGIDLRER